MVWMDTHLEGGLSIQKLEYSKMKQCNELCVDNEECDYWEWEEDVKMCSLFKVKSEDHKLIPSAKEGLITGWSIENKAVKNRHLFNVK